MQGRGISDRTLLSFGICGGASADPRLCDLHSLHDALYDEPIPHPARGRSAASRAEGSTNLAFIGQFCEIQDDVVFTVEYSVRSAQMAVYKLLKIDKEPPPLYQGQRDLLVFIDAIETMFS